MSDSIAPVFQAPAVEALAPLFPHFEILNLIACGGMGAVYRARQASLDRIVAIKILPPELGADREYAEKFQAEARLMASLSNPHIVTVFDFGMAGSYLYFVMEYVDGRTLHEILEESGPMKLDPCLRAMAEVCRGLDYAHEKGLVHLDIKPGNIMINREGEARILDFGLAKLLDPRKGSAKESMGTPDYAAPERLIDSAKVDHRADIYSLGIMFYELLTGKVPRGTFTPASRVAGVDPGVDVIISKCTKQKPSERYQRAREIFGALVRLRRNAAHVKRAGVSPVTHAVATVGGTGQGGKAGTDAAVAYQQMMAGKGAKVWLGWMVGLISVGAVVAILLLTGVLGGGNGKKGKRGKRDGGGVVVTDPVPSKPPKVRPERPENPEVKPTDPENGGSDVDPGGETTPENPDGGRSLFPPEGLDVEIAKVREAMEEGKALDELEGLELIQIHDGRAYYLIPRRLTWAEADAFASEHGGHLASVTSEEEEKFVRETWFDSTSEERGSRPLWIGGRLVEDGWNWVSGEEWDYEGWPDGAPDKAATGSPMALVIHEASWVSRPEEISYSSLIEWSPPKKAVATVPDPGPGMPEVAKPPSRPLTALEKLRKGFEDAVQSGVVEKRNEAVRGLGENYLGALQALWEKSSSDPVREAQVSAEIVRYKAARTPPETRASWPDLGRLQGVLITESRRIDEKAREDRLGWIRTYGEELLKMQADFTSKAQWDQVNLAKEERERVEGLKKETGFATVRATPKGLEEITVLSESDKMMRFVELTPDGGRYLVSGADGNFRVYNSEMGDLESEWEAGHPLARCGFLPGGDRFVALGSGGRFEIWSLSKKTVVFSEKENEGAPFRLAISPRGDACVVGMSAFRAPKEGGAAGIRPWALSDPPVRGEFSDKVPNAWMVFSPDGRHLAVSTRKGLFLLVYGETEPVWTNTDCRGEAVTYSADGKVILCGRITVDAAIGETVSDLRKVEPERFLDDEEARNMVVNAVALDGDGIHVVFGLFGGGIELWNLETSERVYENEDAHTGGMTGAEMNKAGDRLATSDVSGAVKLWRILR